jgi:hypothetical protein
VIERMSVTRRIIESAKNNVRKVRLSRLSHLHSASSHPIPLRNSALDAHKQADVSIAEPSPARPPSPIACALASRVYWYVCLPCRQPFTFSHTSFATIQERLWLQYSVASDANEPRLPTVERCLLVLFSNAETLRDVLSYLALSLFPLDLLLTTCRPRATRLPHKHTTQLFVQVPPPPVASICQGLHGTDRISVVLFVLSASDPSAGHAKREGGPQQSPLAAYARLCSTGTDPPSPLLPAGTDS